MSMKRVIRKKSKSMKKGFGAHCRIRKQKYIVNIEDAFLGMKLDPKCIIKCGYLVKSPPLEKILNRVARWHMRWFVLYDTKERSEIDPMVEREIELYYYKNYASQKQGELPKGKISLIGADIHSQHGKLHGFPYVINIETEERVFHLCATQKFVYKDWLETLKEHYIPVNPMELTVRFSVYDSSGDPIEIKKTPIHRVQTGPNRPYRIPENMSNERLKSLTAPTSPLYSPERSPLQPRQENPFGEASKYFDPYTHIPNRTTSNVSEIRAEDFGQILSRVKTLDIQQNDDDDDVDYDIDEDDDDVNYDNFYNDDDDEDDDSLNTSCPVLKLRMKKTLSNFPLHPDIQAFDSDDTDEGIVRTSSESSSTSTTTNVQVMTTPYTTSTHNQWNLENLFPGPKLTSTNKAPLKHKKSISMLDLRCLQEKPKLCSGELRVDLNNTNERLYSSSSINEEDYLQSSLPAFRLPRNEHHVRTNRAQDDMFENRKHDDLRKRLAIYEKLRKNRHITISYIANV